MDASTISAVGFLLIAVVLVLRGTRGHKGPVRGDGSGAGSDGGVRADVDTTTGGDGGGGD